MIRFVSHQTKTLVAALCLSSVALGASAQSGASATAASASEGQKLFGTHCARCHGADATGTAEAPNLLPRVKSMSEAAFTSAVLQRYRWSIPAAEAGGESAGRDAMIQGVLSRQTGGDGMPAWQTQPAVAQGVRDLYVYLSERAR